MKSLRITVKFTSPVASLLQSDTIFGQFCWEYRYIYGENKLGDLLGDYGEEPFIVFSDGFIENTVRMPFLKPKTLAEMKRIFGGEDYYSKTKQLKNSEVIRIDEKWVSKRSLSLFDLAQYVFSEEELKKMRKSSLLMKNSINRISNTTKEGLYSVKEYFFNTNVHIYAKYDDSKIDEREIKETFESMGKFGFGRDKSTGKGRFDVVGVEEDPPLLKERNAETFISLSNGVPCDDCRILFGKTFTKFGKHGGTAVFGNPFKNPIIMFKSGSIFKVVKKKEIYGRAFNLSKYESHIHSAYMIPLFVDVEE